MNIRRILAGTAIAALALAAAPQLGAPHFTTAAEARVNVSIGVFYDQLGQYGDWVNYNDRYVFIPTDVNDNWRPYTEGHWVFTKRYGWTWVSDEPFGWATYHYGRWGYAEEVGWYWVPGTRWAPAWVSWRRSNDYVVWAPLPPSGGGGVDVSINVNVGDIPDYYWVAVPTRRFLAPDLRVAIVNDDRDIRQVVERTEYIGTPQVTNNIVVNNVIDVNVIAQETGEKVKPVEVRTTDNPAEAKATADQVTAFQGEIAPDTKEKPQKLTDVTKVKKLKRNQAGGKAATPADQNATTAPDATAPADATGTATKKQDTTSTGTQPATDQAATPPGTAKVKKKASDTAAGTAEQPATGQAATPPVKDKKKATQQSAEQPVTGKNKKKKNVETGGNAQAPQDNAGSADQPAAQAQDQPQGKKKKKQQPASQDATGSTSQAPAVPDNGDMTGGKQGGQNANAPAGNGNKGKGKGKKNQPCDPSTGADCAAAQ